MKKEKCSGIIPVRKNKEWEILIVLHRSGIYWGFPKGHNLEIETSLETAARELQEETGLVIDKLLFDLPYKESYHFSVEGTARFKEVEFFVAQVKGDLCLLPNEILGAKWCSFEEASHLLTFENAKKIAAQVYDQLQTL